MLRERLHGQLWTQTASGRVIHVFEPVMLALALLVIPVIVIQASDLGEPWDTIAYVADWVIWVGFAAELVFVLTVASQRLRALRAHWLDAAIVLVSFPQLPGLLSSARLIRLVRLLRLARLGLFGARALQSARVLTTRQGFRYVSLSVVVLVIVAGAAVRWSTRTTSKP